MNETLLMILAFLTGITLGILFFGGLWITVNKAVNAKSPALWIFGSFVLRICMTIVGFYLIGASDWQRLVLCLFGFMLARYLVLRSTKIWDTRLLNLKKENIYGS